MSEAVLQADLQRELLKITSLFSAGDVVINNWKILDQGNAQAPYVIIEHAEVFVTKFVRSQWSTEWNIPFSLVETFTDWDTTRNLVSVHRATILAALLDTDHYSEASGLLAFGISEIHGNSEVPVYDRYPENTVEAIPVFLAYRMSLIVQEIRTN